MTARRPVIPIQPAEPAPAVPQSMYVAEARIHPRSVSGFYNRWRWTLVALTQLFFYGMPWLNWNGRQALLFDLDTGRFFVGGLVMFPQDLAYLAALLVLSALVLFFFTAVAGRLWCGYACPQTVYTELFLWIELRTEGDRTARMRLDKQPWSNPDKLLRRGGKHAGWLALALVTGFTFVGYFMPIRTLAGQLMQVADAAWPWFWVLFYAGMTYANAGFVREQMCKYICPYARFQSALIDRDSLIISYDTQRGEPRGARPRGVAAASVGKGDCVDCTLCVQVCPTGIDIRKGLQNECIGCSACIDACNGVMDKIGAPRGLIRYATENGMQQNLTRGAMFRRVVRPRVLIYGALLFGLGSAFAWSLSHRPPLRVDIIKDRNTLGRLTEDGQVENVYRLQVMNLSEHAKAVRVAAEGAPGLQVRIEGDHTLPAAGRANLTAVVRLPQAEAARLGSGAHSIELRVAAASDDAEPERTVRAATMFFVPR